MANSPLTVYGYSQSSLFIPMGVNGSIDLEGVHGIVNKFDLE